MQTIPYSKFKHGQRVTYDFYGTKVSDGKIVKKNGMVYLYPLDIMLCTINTDYLEATSTIKNIKFLDRTLDDLEEGDVLVHQYGGPRKILGKCGEVYFLSEHDDFSFFDVTMTMSDIKFHNYTLKQEEPEEENLVYTTEYPAIFVSENEDKISYKGKTYILSK